ncbi:MAG: FAD-binding protein [Xanthomonadales bacterium]|nr:FAD-binding protein [Xanthomonadales bacterium]
MDVNPSPHQTRFLDALQASLGADVIRRDQDSRHAHGGDDSTRHQLPLAVLLPVDADQVVAAVRLCREHGIALTARGAGTGTTGAAVPARGSVVLSLARMDRIVRIDPGQRLAVVQPGVINARLQEAAADHGFFWAPDPASAQTCTIGGNLACNAGGPRTVKYGATRDNVLALTAVDGQGRRFQSTRPLSKQATGYDLTRLLVGSEGTLAVIVEAALKLTPLPQARAVLQARFDDIAAATHAVGRLLACAQTPAAVEFLDGKSLRLARRHGGDVVPEAGALLLIQIEGSAADLAGQAAAVAEAVRVRGLAGLDEAREPQHQERLWAARRALSPALRSVAPKKINEDVVVPIPALPELTVFLDRLERDSGLTIVCFGHAGNGNLHVNLMYDPADAAQATAAPLALAQLFEKVVALGGTLSGEHGIGLSKRPFMPLAVDPVALSLMRGLKQVFDPDGILNPGKVLPD